MQLTQTVTGPLAALFPHPVQQLSLTPVDAAEHVFVTQLEGAESWTPVIFFTLPDGSRYLQMEGRSTPRVS